MSSPLAIAQAAPQSSSGPASAGSSPAKKRKPLAVSALLCVICTLVGAFYPTMVDWSKTALQRSLVVSHSGTLTTREVRAYPFSPVSVVLMDDALQVSIGLCFVAKKVGLRSMWSDWRLVLKMAPLGVIYALGELLTLRSVQKGSGPVYVVIANMKLVVAALMSRAFFGRAVAMPWKSWIELVLISLAAAAYTLSEAGASGGQISWEGAWAALLKSSLVAFTSVFCEHLYKSNSFYVTLTLQALWGLVLVILSIGLSFAGLAFTGIALELRDQEGVPSIFASGPALPLCSSSAALECIQGAQKLLLLPPAGQVLCQCISRRGWDVYTLHTVLANLTNAVTSALVFRQMSAVAKYVCRASSAVPMYIFYCSMGRTVWSLRTFSVVASLSLLVAWYTLERHHATESVAAAKHEEARWTQHYTSCVNGPIQLRSSLEEQQEEGVLRRRQDS